METHSLIHSLTVLTTCDSLQPFLEAQGSRLVRVHPGFDSSPLQIHEDAEDNILANSRKYINTL
uniref:Uncharacterized protein n=1 Tax=Scleropages formosus TaxID=113540 RepID=A0A8C9R2Z0_SCLFO